MALTVGELLVFLRLDGLPLVERGLGSMQAGMNATAGAAERMGGAVGMAERTMAASTRTSAVAAAQSAKHRAAQLGAVAAQERYTTVTTKGTASLRELAIAEKQLILANERLRVSSPAASIAQTGTAAEVAATRMASLRGVAATGVATLGKLGLAFGVFEFAKKAFDITKQANEFHRAMVQVQTNADVAASEVNKASSALLDMAGPVAAAPDKLAVAWYHAKSVGLDYAKSIETTRIAAEGARVGHADLEETMNALTSTVASNIPGVETMSKAMGQLISIVGTGDMKLKDLNEALGSGILTVVKGYGLSLTDVGAALATFGDNNIRGADAATMLRMAVQAMAVPAKNGRDQLAALGLSTHTLAKDMQTGGLNKAILDLKAHLDDAGVSSVEVGAILTEVFGKRAGPGLAVLIGQVDRLESKFQILGDAGANFNEKWKATTETASFALARLGHSAEAAGITLTAKLGPSIAAAANWLGTNIPAAISRLRDVLGPTAHLAGVVLGGAFKALAVTLSTTRDALSALGRLLSSHKTIVTAVATAVAGMWAAFKLYGIAVTAMRAVGTAAALVVTGVGRARLGIAAMATTANLAMGIVGVAVIAATGLWMKHREAVAKQKAVIEELTAAYKADTGAIGDNTKAAVAHQLQSEGVADAARKVGLSLKTLESAALGNKDAIAEVNAAYKAFMGTQNDSTSATASHYKEDTKSIKAWNQVKDAVGGTDAALRKAMQAYENEAELQGKSTDEAKKHAAVLPKLTQFEKDYAQAQKELHIVLEGTTYAMKAQGTAADILNAAIARLSGDKNAAAETELALADSLASITGQIKEQAKQYKDHGTSLNANTAEGRKNLEMLHQQIDQINALASAQLKAGASPQTVMDTLKKKEEALRDIAVDAGLSGKAVDDFIAKFAVKPKDLVAYIKANTDDAATKALAIEKKLKGLAKERKALVKIGDETGEGSRHIQDRIDALTRPVYIPVRFSMPEHAGAKAVDALGQITGPGYASGTDNAQPGWRWVGEYGPELMRFYGGEQVKTTTASMAAVVRAATYRPSISVPSSSSAPMLTLPSAGGGAGTRHVTLNLKLERPLPERDSVSLPKAIHAAELALEKF